MVATSSFDLILGCQKVDLTFSYSSNSHYKNRFFESTPTACFQKTDFGVPSAVGAGNTKICFIMRIAGATVGRLNLG
jgi:hypothetical protein